MDVDDKTTWRNLLLRQSGALWDLGSWAWRFPELATQPRGGGRPVLLCPGFGVGDLSMLPLRGYLHFLGYWARGWEIGLNNGDVPALLPLVTQATTRFADEAGQPVRLVGWSLGGYLAREAARERPDSVDRVVTLGTPVVGGPKYTAAAPFYRRRGYDLDEIEAQVEARNAVPIQVPITAIYSRNDGVVAWEACIDKVNPLVEHVEVCSTHVGLGVSPEVYRIVAQRLHRTAFEARPGDNQ